MTAPGARPPAVSVVIPTYQRCALVQEALASVRAQTFADFETIVVDDGSTDGTAEALAPLTDTGDVVYLRQDNRGVAAARNAGIARARGRIVAFLDSDNRWLPDHLATLVAMLDRHPEAVLACTAPRFVLAGREGVERTRLVDPVPDLYTIKWVGFTSSLGVRRKALTAAGGFDETLPVREDVDLWHRLALHGPFAVLQRRTLLHRQTRGSLSARGQETGQSLTALERSARRLANEMEASDRPDVRAHASRPHGQLALVEALRAVEAGDEAAAREAFARACCLLPQLPDEAGLVGYYLRSQIPGAREPGRRARHLALAVAAWPEPASDAGLYLRTMGIAAALRTGRLGLALRLVAGWPPRTLVRGPGLLLRWMRAVVLVELPRRRLRGRESADLHPGRDVGHDDRAHGDGRRLPDRDVVADRGGHGDEDVRAHADVARDVGARSQRGEGADLGVVADQGAPPDHDVVADRRARPDHHPGGDEDAAPEARAARDVRGGVDEPGELPPGRLQPGDDLPPG